MEERRSRNLGSSSKLPAESSELRSEELGDENGSETLAKMARLGETKKFDGELRREEPSDIGSPTETGGADRVREERGDVSPAREVISSQAAVMANGDPVGGEISVESPSSPIGSPSSAAAEVVASNPGPMKGYGLKKWRRIRRDMSKDVTSSPDSAQILKRRLSLAEPSRAHDDRHKSVSDGEGEGDDEGEGSVASLMSMNIGGTPLVVSPPTLDPDLGLLVAATGFNIGVDSENSDDHGSKSSTAASVPRLRYEAIGFGRDRSRTRNVGGEVPGHVVEQRGQRARGGRADAGRKFRENQVKTEVENSYSSVESDLRSSNVAISYVGELASNGKQTEKSMNYDEQSDDAQPSEEVRSAFYKENGGVGELPREDLDANQSGEENNAKSENSRPVSDLDPFFDLIVSLQATKEALENEIQNWKDVILDDCDGQYDETEGISTPTVEANFVELNQKIENLECKLGEALANVEAKESRVLELETILNSTEKCREVEIELENLLEKKIEAEIEYLIMTRTTRSWKVQAEDHIALLEEQKSLSGDQSEMMLKVQNAENVAMTFKERADKLEKDLLQTKEALRLQSRVFKYSLCCFVQMVVLCIAFGLFLMHLLPSSSGVTPT